MATLSFGGDEGEGGGAAAEGQPAETTFKKMKNPNASTAFLPDRARELAAATRREELKVVLARDLAFFFFFLFFLSSC